MRLPLLRHRRPNRRGAGVKPIVGSVAWLCGEVWFGLVAALDRVCAYFPARWGADEPKRDGTYTATHVPTKPGRYAITWDNNGTATVHRFPDDDA